MAPPQAGPIPKPTSAEAAQGQPSGSASQPGSPTVQVGTLSEGIIPPANGVPQAEAGQLDTNPRPADLPGCASPPTTAPDALDLASLKDGETLLCDCLSAIQRVLDFANRLPNELLNVELNASSTAGNLDSDFSDALARARSAASRAEDWLSRLEAALREAAPLAPYADMEPALETLRTCLAKPRTTLDMARCGCEQIGQLLHTVGDNVRRRMERNIVGLGEIKELQDVLGVCPCQPSGPSAETNVLSALRSAREIEAWPRKLLLEHPAAILHPFLAVNVIQD